MHWKFSNHAVTALQKADPLLGTHAQLGTLWHVSLEVRPRQAFKLSANAENHLQEGRAVDRWVSQADGPEPDLLLCVQLCKPACFAYG